LVDGLGGLADAVIDRRDLQCVQDLQQCRLVKGHRALCPFARTIGVVSLTIARWPLCCTQLCRRGSATYTTRGDATVSVALPAEPPTLRPTPAASRGRYQFALGLRELARRRQPVRVLLADATDCDGTIEAVGSDYLELAEHDLGEARRRGVVRARRFIGFAAVVAVTIPQERR
jgi:hypothetical protein